MHALSITSVIVDVVAALGLELVLAGVSLEPVVALAVPFVALPHSAVSVAAAVVGTALMWKIETDLRDIV